MVKNKASAVRWIPVSEVDVLHPKAQRALVESHARSIAENFDPDAVGVIQVAEKNGKNLYHVIDGYHRVTALKMLGWKDQMIEAVVHNEHDPKVLAKLFRKFNKTRKVSRLDDFRVAVTEGAPNESAINRIVKGAGFHVAQSDNTRAIAAVGALCELYRRYGEGALAQTLRFIATTWRDDPDATNSIVLKGVGGVIGEYGDALDVNRLREKVSKKFSAANLIATAKHNATASGSNQTIGAMTALVVEYNKGQRESARLDLPY